MTDEAAADPQGPGPDQPPPPELPEPVRQRVVTLAADAIGALEASQLPAALRRVAAFTPTRRARLAGAQIAAALDADEQLRERVAVQVRADAGGLAGLVDAGTPPAAADPVEVAALAYLLRPEGWRESLARAARSLDADRDRTALRRLEAANERLERRLEEAQQETDRLRARTKEQVEQLKTDNADLRRKLGAVRTQLRQAERHLEEARAGGAEERDAAVRANAASEAEARRLRVRVDQLEEELAAARRTERAGRVDEAVRVRLLVESLVAGAQGLQRELGLPPVERLPADTVEALAAERGARISSGSGSLSVDAPGLLEELLRLPRAHLIVDGYNVTKNAWPELSLERQRDRLLVGVAALRARTGAEITVVFDAAETAARPLVSPPRGVRLLFSPPGVIADDVIRDLVAAEPQGRTVAVASSDAEVVRDVVAAGCRTVGAAALAAAISAR